MIKIYSVLFFISIVILGWLNYTPDLSPEYLKGKYSDKHSSFIKIGDIDVHYRTEGKSDDSIPIVLLHGTGASLHTWDNWVKMLAPQKKVIRLDLPAFGLTGPNPDRIYSMEFYSNFMIKFLDSLNIDQCILGGNSLGGGIALHTAAIIPDRIRCLILCDATGYPSEAESTPMAMRLARVPILNYLFRFITPVSVVRKSVEDVYFDKSKVNESLVMRYYELALYPGNRQAFIDRMSHERFPDMTNVIERISMPTLIIWGEQDKLIPVENAHRFHKDIKESQLLVVVNCGHVPMEELSELSIAPLLSFINDQH
jgi:pimeloyl-ACP methyl ester carboxylesterase